MGESDGQSQGWKLAPAAHISQGAEHLPAGFSLDVASLGSKLLAGAAGTMGSHLREAL